MGEAAHHLASNQEQHINATVAPDHEISTLPKHLQSVSPVEVAYHRPAVPSPREMLKDKNTLLEPSQESRLRATYRSLANFDPSQYGQLLSPQFRDNRRDVIKKYVNSKVTVLLDEQTGTTMVSRSAVINQATGRAQVFADRLEAGTADTTLVVDIANAYSNKLPVEQLKHISDTVIELVAWDSLKQVYNTQIEPFRKSKGT